MNWHELSPAYIVTGDLQMDTVKCDDCNFRADVISHGEAERVARQHAHEHKGDANS